MNLFASLPFLRPKLKHPRQVVSTAWSDRDQILNEETNLFCWKRPVNQAVTDYLKSCIEKNLPPIISGVTSSDLDQKLSDVRGSWDLSHSNGADAFWKDVLQLITDFLSFSKNGRGVLHIRIVDDNACTKFHMDGYTLRLLTTYYGPGTQWLPEQATNRKGLGKSNNLIIKDHSQIKHMEPFEVGILKGEVPNKLDATRGIVHRSPEIERFGEKRVILRVDI